MIVEILKSRWKAYHKKHGENPDFLEVTEDEYNAYKDYLFPGWQFEPKTYKSIKQLFFYGKELIIKDNGN